MSRTAPRFVLAALLLAAAGAFLQVRPHREVLPPRLPIDQFPPEMDGWRGTDVPITKDVVDVLGQGDFLHRVYQNETQPEPAAELFIAYFPSQRAGDTIHSPQNCIPGSGWTPIQSETKALTAPGYASFPANRYIIAKGDSRQLVLYWYWAHGRGLANEYWAKFYLVVDSIRRNRSDGALVRISTAIYPGETAAAAEQRILPFATGIVPRLKNFIPD